MSADKPVASAEANGSDAADLAKVCAQPAATNSGTMLTGNIRPFKS
jgi:hypothetical protein